MTSKQLAVVGLIREYYRRTQRDEYTDVGDVWELLDEMHRILCGESLSGWEERVGVPVGIEDFYE